MDTLAVYKALGDDTRFALYRELSESTSARSAGELAERLGLHANTVRPHLDRMRDVGLVEVETVRTGTVGRPQLRYSLASGGPGPGADPPSHTLLAGLLAALAEQLGADGADAAVLGRRWGEAVAAPRQGSGTCLAVLTRELDRLGFDPSPSGPEPGDDGGEVRVGFLGCPFRELAEAHPELVCNLHRGIVEGVVERSGRGMVERFATLLDRDPCTVTVGYPEVTSEQERVP